MKSLRIAVVGGGIFGVTSAVDIARVGHRVDLFERSSDILQGASGINQYRLHRGYHYPRSRETAVQSMVSEAGFVERYGSAVLTNHDHYYAIARSGSLVTAAEYERFCSSLRLEYDLSWPSVLRRDPVAMCMKVRESLFDPVILRELCRAHLRAAGVHVYLETAAHSKQLADYDFVVIAAYSEINEVLEESGETSPVYQFEVCEKPVVRLPEAYRGNSVVVMDGPFMCIDPLGSSGLFVLGNVRHAIHHSNIGPRADVPPALKPLLNKGIIENPPITHFPDFIESADNFFDGIRAAEHLGSMFTVRAVLSGLDATDARPTIVTPISRRMASVFSGKIVTCVEAATQVVQLITARSASSQL